MSLDFLIVVSTDLHNYQLFGEYLLLRFLKVILLSDKSSLDFLHSFQLAGETLSDVTFQESHLPHLLRTRTLSLGPLDSFMGFL